MKRALLAMVVAGCASSPSVGRAELGPLTYDVPAGWTSVDRTSFGRAMVEWAPSDNDRKESITIIRADRPALAKRSGGLGTLLREATARLPDSWFGVPNRVKTKAGLAGVQSGGHFTPHGHAAPYQRLHAVLSDGTHLVHVIYTAREFDREVFEVVVDSLHLARGV